MNKDEIRYEALRLAVTVSNNDEPAANIVDRAAAFEAFLNGERRQNEEKT